MESTLQGSSQHQLKFMVLLCFRLQIVDESNRYDGKYTRKGGLTHLRVIIAAEQFEGLTDIKRHRLVFKVG